jgi:glycosyltransferase involved in cell wall biosynthesis
VISVTLLAKNSEKFLREVLTSLKDFDEVLIYDNGSTDRTLEIARTFPNVRIEKGEFLGFGKSHNVASALAKNDWIFSLDTDEVLTEALLQEIQKLQLDPDTVYSIPRENRYRGRVIKGCGWSPDRVYRLYHRKKTAFSEAWVHEKILTEGMKTKSLKHSVIHYSYSDLSDFLKKMNAYSELFAEERKGKVSSSPFKALARGFFAFFKSYFIKRGILDGYPGFVISAYNGHTAFYKYLKLYEKNQDIAK